MTSSHNSYDITATIFDIVSTVSVSSHTLYWWYHTNWIFVVSSAIHDDIISIVYYITATECLSSYPPFQRYNTLCLQDITPTLCILSCTLYKAPRPHLMTSHHIIYDITPTISEMASTISVSSQWLYWWSKTNCLYDFIPTLHIPSFALYTMSHPLFMTSHNCSYHITSTAFMTSHTLYMTSHTWQYKRYICHLIHYI